MEFLRRWLGSARKVGFLGGRLGGQGRLLSLREWLHIRWRRGLGLGSGAGPARGGRAARLAALRGSIAACRGGIRSGLLASAFDPHIGPRAIPRIRKLLQYLLYRARAE